MGALHKYILLPYAVVIGYGNVAADYARPVRKIRLENMRIKYSEYNTTA